MNENYVHPAMPEGVEEGILKGMYCYQDSKKPQLQLLGSGTILLEVIKAAKMLKDDFSIDVNIWSVTSFNELYRDGTRCEREALMQPEAQAPKPYVTECLEKADVPVVAATDYMRAYANQLRAYIPGKFTVLGTDGYGRSDTRAKLRHFFEVDAKYIVLASLKTLADTGAIPASKVTQAIKRYGIDSNKPDPMMV